MRKIIILSLIVILLFLTSCEQELEMNKSKVILVSVALTYENTNLNVLKGAYQDQKAIIDQFRHLAELDEREFISHSITQKGTATNYNVIIDALRGEDINTSTRILLTDIKAKLEEIFNNLEGVADENDLFIFYYSGHGDGNIKLESHKSYNGALVMGDLVFDSNNNWHTKNTNYKSILSAVGLKCLLSGIKSNKLVLLDSCHSGNHIVKDVNSYEMSELNTAISEMFYEVGDTKNNSWELVSSKKEELSYESAANGYIPHGFFSKIILETLGYEFYNGTYEGVGEPEDLLLSVSDLYLAADKNIKIDKQHPQYSKNHMDLVLFNFY